MDFFKKTGEYLKGVSAESKRVSWPGWSELKESTLVVIAFIFILAATALFYDKVIEAVLRLIKG